MSKLKVLHVVYSSQPDVTGASIRTQYVVEAQARLGLDPIVLSSPFQKPVAADCARGVEWLNGIPHYRCFNGIDYGEFMAADKSTTVRSRKLLELLPFAARIRRVAQRERVQVIHAHNIFFCGLAAALAARSLGLPCIYEVRSLTEECLVEQGAVRSRGLVYSAYRLLDWLTFALASHIVAISNGLRDDVTSRGTPAGRVTVVGNGVDVNRHTPSQPRNAALMEKLGFPSDAFVLGYIGTLFSYETLDLLIDAVASLRDKLPSVRVVLVGTGDAASRLRALADARGLNECVRFVGTVPHNEIGPYYDLIDLFVLPRRRNRLTELVTPLKPLEIMARAKPVLASNCGGHVELIEDGVNGYLFDVERPGSLAERILELSGRRADLDGLGLRARSWASVHRSWDLMVEPTLSLYSRLSSPSIPVPYREPADGLTRMTSRVRSR